MTGASKQKSCRRRQHHHTSEKRHRRHGRLLLKIWFIQSVFQRCVFTTSGKTHFSPCFTSRKWIYYVCGEKWLNFQCFPSLAHKKSTFPFPNTRMHNHVRKWTNFSRGWLGNIKKANEKSCPPPLLRATVKMFDRWIKFRYDLPDNAGLLHVGYRKTRLA